MHPAFRPLCVFLLLASVVLAQGTRRLAPFTVMADTIPARAAFPTFVKLNPKNPTMKPEEAAATGQNLAQAIPQLHALAQQHGANLVVLIGAEHGISVPIEGVRRPLVILPDGPTVTAVFFRWDGAPSPTDSEKAIRFTTNPAPSDKYLPGDTIKKISENIGLKSAPANSDLATWVYLNLPRFVSDAIRYEFDTISIASTADASFQTVWLPGCDQPLKVSTTKPNLSVTIFKRLARE